MSDTHARISLYLPQTVAAAEAIGEGIGYNESTMPRYEDKYGNTRLYVGRLASRTRSRDLERVFSRYGR
ncbi:hypothetical protein Ahy_A06g026058 isoform C [Arachis hypogaea]|nr:hypothetical protein Ahy_A06g026058 isoform C [Arachis hypogaea]